MAIIYVAGEFKIHHLNLADDEAIEKFRQALESAIREIHPNKNDKFFMDDDVEIEITETAGKSEKK